MMALNDEQRDALIEICNVGMSKAAKQLSMLLNGHIDIAIPEIKLFSLKSIYEDAVFRQDEQLAYVWQVLSNELNGRALLIFHREHTTILTQSVIGLAPRLTEKEIRACEQEAMLEIGNIIISSCMSAMMNMLNCSVKLSVPKYSENNISDILQFHIDDVGGAGDLILMETCLDAVGQDISGKLFLMMTRESVDKLLIYLKKLLSG